MTAKIIAFPGPPLGRKRQRTVNGVVIIPIKTKKREDLFVLAWLSPALAHTLSVEKIMRVQQGWNGGITIQLERSGIFVKVPLRAASNSYAVAKRLQEMLANTLRVSTGLQRSSVAEMERLLAAG